MQLWWLLQGFNIIRQASKWSVVCKAPARTSHTHIHKQLPAACLGPTISRFHQLLLHPTSRIPNDKLFLFLFCAGRLPLTLLRQFVTASSSIAHHFSLPSASPANPTSFSQWTAPVSLPSTCTMPASAPNPPAKDPNKASLTQKQRRKVSHAGIDSPATYALSLTSILPAVRRLWTGLAGLHFALSKHKH